jgi:hypothetical protein
MTILDPFELPLAPREMIGLYLFLKRHEESITPDVASVLEKLRSRLYLQLSIDEMENLEVYLGVLSAVDSKRR